MRDGVIEGKDAALRGKDDAIAALTERRSCSLLTQCIFQFTHESVVLILNREY